jgi:hypothetical protein
LAKSVPHLLPTTKLPGLICMPAPLKPSWPLLCMVGREENDVFSHKPFFAAADDLDE